MVWGLLITRQERELHEYFLDSFYKNGHLFLRVHYATYVMCSVLFWRELSLIVHIGMGTVMILGSLFYLSSIQKYLNSSGRCWSLKTSFVIMFFIYLVWYVWWCTYFYFLSEYKDVVLLQQFNIIFCVNVLLAIVTVGRFERIVNGLVVLFVLFSSVSVYTRQIEDYVNYIIQISLLAAAVVFASRYAHRQARELFHIKGLNAEVIAVLRGKNQLLEQVNQSQTLLLATVGQNLRQPLHGLSLLHDQIMQQSQQTELTPTLNQMASELIAVNQSFASFEQISRIDFVQYVPKMTPVSVQKMLTYVVDEFALLAERRGIALNIHHSAIWVYTDEYLLRSMLFQLVSNALRFTNAGRVVVGVRRRGATHIDLAVYDTGVGMSSERVAQIFQSYDETPVLSERDETPMVGMGLMVVGRIAKWLGVTLTIRSLPNVGSSFAVRLPICAPELVEQSVQDSGASSPDTLRGKRVVVLDSNEQALAQLEQLLVSWGMDVSVALSAEMVREFMAQEGGFDLVLSEYELGVVGESALQVFEVARSMQTNHPVHCVVLTDDSRDELAQKVAAARAELIYKPIRPMRLRAYLTTLLH